uniref:Protein kinase domain-containing protein n=1 Tax=Denticeps clupeoides TaxID=299321 RepID=A0AAY4E1M7_9TELE
MDFVTGLPEADSLTLPVHLVARNLKTGQLVAIKIQDCALDTSMDIEEKIEVLKTLVHENIPKTLLYLHQKGFVHGDISPSNIFLNGAGEVRIFDHSSMENEIDTFIDGTPTYVAPEIVLGDLIYGPPDLRKRAKWSPAFRSFLEDLLNIDSTTRPSVEVLLQHEFLKNVGHEPSPLKSLLCRNTFLGKIRKFLYETKLKMRSIRYNAHK